MSKKKELNFEDKMQRIREIADIMQSGKLSLEENLKLYTEAGLLIRECHSFLEAADIQIRKVTGEGKIENVDIEL
jgi:exodeoxyribonuclease VII small subunit